ncbi:monocarboxylate transporter 12 [Aplysia californica]|uniref:Monocarboxylate transporter 12 n=1 Tax=Aplysia californica TaxID=6500 RepID=A0ABM1VZ64_APLCA|nr:monocarboxylate transporter 12 [Aplysia californica]
MAVGNDNVDDDGKTMDNEDTEFKNRVGGRDDKINESPLPFAPTLGNKGGLNSHVHNDEEMGGDRANELARTENVGEREKGKEEEDVKDEITEDDTSGVPIDRGYAYVICAACFGMHVLVVGGIKSFGVLFVEIQDKYDVTARELGVAQGVTMTLMMGLGFVANMLSAQFTSQKVVFVGGILSGVGFLLTAVIPTYDWIYVTYCAVTGLGFALSYAPCVVMVGCHFRKYRSVANGIAVSGSGIGSFAIPNLIRFLLNKYGLFGCLIILAAILLNISVFALLLRPLSSYVKAETLQIQPESSPSDKGEEEEKFIDGGEEKTTTATTENEQDKTSYLEKAHFCDIPEVEYMEQQQPSGHNNDTVTYELDDRSPLSISQTSLHRRQNRRPGAVADAVAGNGDASRDRYTSNGDLMFASLQSIPQKEVKKASARTWSRIQNVVCCRGNGPGGKPIFDWSLLKNPVFLVYWFSVCFGNMGYPNVFIMLPPHVESLGQSRDMSALLMSIIGLSDLVGRLFFGWFSNMDIIPRHYGFILCMAASGVLLLIVPALSSMAELITFSALYGLVAGSFIAMIAVMLADKIGTEKLGSSFGLTTLGMAVSACVGPPICGALRDITHSWNAAFIFCGVITIFGSSLPLLEPMALRRQASKAEGHRS